MISLLFVIEKVEVQYGNLDMIKVKSVMHDLA